MLYFVYVLVCFDISVCFVASYGLVPNGVCLCVCLCFCVLCTCVCGLCIRFDV